VKIPNTHAAKNVKKLAEKWLNKNPQQINGGDF
jgi:hypothetical protein